MWAYILFWQFWGPEMTQAERDEEAAAVFEYERLRAQGVSLAEIGAGKVKIQKADGEIVTKHIDDIEIGDETATKPSEKV